MSFFRKGMNAKTFIAAEGDFAQLKEWDGLKSLNGSCQIKGVKASVTAIMLYHCLNENLLKRNHVFSFLQTALEKKLVSKEEIQHFLNGEKYLSDVIKNG
jgi:hypothetical protein